MIGQRVLPRQKTAGSLSLSETSSWKRAVETKQNFLYVVGYFENEKGGCWILSDEKESQSGDFFKSEDFEEV